MNVKLTHERLRGRMWIEKVSLVYNGKHTCLSNSINEEYFQWPRDVLRESSPENSYEFLTIDEALFCQTLHKLCLIKGFFVSLPEDLFFRIEAGPIVFQSWYQGPSGGEPCSSVFTANLVMQRVSEGAFKILSNISDGAKSKMECFA